MMAAIRGSNGIVRMGVCVCKSSLSGFVYADVFVSLQLNTLSDKWQLLNMATKNVSIIVQVLPNLI